MMILLTYFAALVGLVVILGVIASKTLAMVREGRPLVAVGALQWHGNAPRTRPQPQPRQQPAHAADPNKPRLLAALSARLRPAAQGAVEAVPEAPPRERSRRLASLSEVSAAEAADRRAVALPTAADFAAGVEQQIEAELDRLCAGVVELPVFAAFVAAQQVELDRHLAAAPDAETTAVLEAAAAIIAFSRDWVSQQQ